MHFCEIFAFAWREMAVYPEVNKIIQTYNLMGISHEFLKLLWILNKKHSYLSYIM